MKTIFRTLALLTLLSLVLSACGPAAAPERTALKVGYVLWPGFYPLLIAKEKGFFEKHGVTVEPKFYGTTTEEYADYAAQNLDGMGLVIGDLLPLSTGDSSRIIMVTDFSNGADQVVASKDIASIADLRGKRIGVKLGSFGELLVRKMLEENGMGVGDITFVDVAPELLPASFGSQVDAGHTYDPFTSQSLAKGGHVIYDSSDVPGLIPDVIAFSTKTVETRPAELQAFVDAWFEAQIWWKENPAEAAELLAKATGLKPEEISSVGVQLQDLAGNQAAFTPGTDTGSLYFTAQEYIKFLSVVGLLSTAPNVETLLDPTFIK